ncbi:MAG: CopG family DNA-binding protein [Candidatus Methanohalarchaeum thermophilum]|uniref:CopG family DNA-binding protein n=1 Tax=Methanohalarchaeum thermophilum TaxID=1903181 RepID=A0A1Q6DSH0_METT1|nr:MAG: CopG family DNA-binding protein [Candidatus Methanohalarchaeum thermophilum]
MEDLATIQVEKETRKRLKELRITKRETYDEILNRLVKNVTNLKNKD